MNGFKFFGAFVAGLIAAIVLAVIWAAITSATSFQIGYMAVGVGFAVAFAVRFAGRSHGQAFAFLSAALALFGCLLGNYLAATTIAANQKHVDPVSAALLLLPHAPAVIGDTFNAMDLVFYALGVWFGYKYALVPLNRKEEVQPANP